MFMLFYVLMFMLFVWCLCLMFMFDVYVVFVVLMFMLFDVYVCCFVWCLCCLCCLLFWCLCCFDVYVVLMCMFCCCFVWCFVVVLFDVYVAARCHAAARRCCPPFAHQIWCVNLRGPRWLRRREEGQRIRGVLGAVRGGPRPVLGWSWGFPGTPLGPPKAVRKLLEIF